MKKAGVLFLLFLWIVGAIGGVGSALYYKVELPIILGMVIIFLFSIPTAVRIFEKFRA